MKTKILLMVVVLTGLLFSQSASADLITIVGGTGSVPITGVSWDEKFDIPKFNTNLGELQSVKIATKSCGAVYTEIDSEDKKTATWNLIARGGVRVTIADIGTDYIVSFGTPASGVPKETCPDDPNELPLDKAYNPDFDPDVCDYEIIEYGTVDTIPTSPICANNETILSLADGDDLSPFEGIAGTTFEVDVSSESNSDALGSSASRGVQGYCWAGADVTVTYTYLERPPLCINGTKTNDCTGAGIPDWEICLTKPNGETICTFTNANGDYSFCDLEPGDYTVTEKDRAGWVHLDEPSRDVTLIDVSEENVDFLNTPLFCISGHKFNSKTNAGVSGWKITLLDASGAVLDQKLTGTGGYYEFCGLLPGDYTVVEETRSGWKATTPISIPVTLVCENSENNDFYNEPTNLVCVCPFFIRNELYGASCKEVKVVDASKGVISNDPPGSVVLNPESITIDPKYGTIEVNEDGSFVYDPTVATGRLYSGMYVMFKYNANNGLCDSVYPGIAKIQLRC